MPVENFKSREAYRRWNAYRHVHGIPAPHLKTACIRGKCHQVKHSKLSSRKLGARRTWKRGRRKAPARKRE
ncbi:MAG: hypothetical protein WA213_20755 [Terriglobales bacterium]